MSVLSKSVVINQSTTTGHQRPDTDPPTTNSPTIKRAWILWFFAALFYAYQFLLRVSPGVMSDELVQVYAIDATQLGLLTSFYYYAYVGMQLPLGIIIDKMGSERIIAFAALLLGGASVLFALAPNIVIASIARFLMGGCSACGWIGCVILTTRWFSPQQKGLIISLTMGLGTLGAMLGGMPLEVFISYVGWRKALEILSLVGLLIGVILYLVVYSIPAHLFPLNKISLNKIRRKTAQAPSHSTSQSTWNNLKTIMKKPQCWIVPAHAMLMWLPIAIIGDQWGVSFLERYYQLDEGMAATFIACLFIGVSIGGPFFVLLAHKLSSYKIPLFMGAILCCSLYSIIVFVPGIPFIVLYILFFLAGVCFTSQLLCFSIVTDSTPSSISGTTMAFTNMIIMISGIIGLPAIGWILDWSAGSTGSLGMEGYSADDFRTAFTFIPICMILAGCLVFKIRDTYPK
ncbi:MAG: MFS transporter [Pseudomonadota bacterium]